MRLNRFRARPMSFESWLNHRMISTPFRKKLGFESNEPITSINLNNCVTNEFMDYGHALRKIVSKH